MPVPVISVETMRAWEAASWAAGETAEAVIQRVGRIVAARALKLTRPGDRLLLLAGRGHNGDDVRASLPHLAAREVDLIDVVDPLAQVDAVRVALGRKPALVIDGLFGIGLNRPLSKEWQELIKWINQTAGWVMAVDVPSGLNADTGADWGAAIRADLTLTLGAPKAGLLAPAAGRFVGRLEVAPEIGLAPGFPDSDQWWAVPADFAALIPRRVAAGHKGTFGHLVILGGSPGYHGAAVLAARAAQRAQPGLVSLFTPPSVYLPVATQLQAVMVQEWTPAVVWPNSSTAFVLGPGLAAPGLSPEMRATVDRLWHESSAPVIVDASALDWLSPGAPRGDGTRVITPHPGEAARLLGVSTAAVQADRAGALRKLSQLHGGCWVVLKGQHTLVGRDGEEIHLNPSGNPYLAQGGAGDVLAGFLGGLLAQPAWQMSPRETIRYAVWAHGLAADLLSERRPNWVIEDLVEILGQTNGAEIP
ncbi:MAG: NAD(P)H-hydrate dehydratase [Limisphaerales bacterium]